MSKSYLPNGGYTLTQGSNYMMDGFQFDSEYGGGPQEKARLPSAKGLADLPSGMIPMDSSGISTLPEGIENEVDLNMGEITREATQSINIVDHSWLASQPEPDLSGSIEMEQVYKNLEEGHMNNKEYNSLKSLEEAWGQTSTTGLDIIPNSNRSHEPYRNTYRDDQSNLPGDDYREMMEKNVRKLAYGHSLNHVLAEVEESLILDVKAKLASEYGLHGRVYIKEEYFPGLFNGRWNEVINKRCATSMFIIPKNEDCAYDRFLGMEIVKSIPWKKASKALLPKLESYGVRIATGKSKTKLQRAFIDLIEGRVARSDKSATWFPTQLDQSSLISLDHARKELDDAREENIFIASTQEVEQSKISSKLQRIANQLVAQRFLESEQVEAIVKSDKSASKKIERLYELASQPVDSTSYEGQGKNASYHNMRNRQSNGDEQVPQKGSRELALRSQAAQKKIASLISANLITIEEVQKVAKGKTPEDKVASVLIHLAKPKKVSSYKQYDVKEHRMVKDRKKPLDSVPNRQKRANANLWKEAHAKVDKLVETGLLAQEQVNSISNLKNPNDFVRKAFDLASKPNEVNQYQGGQSAHILNGSKKSNQMSATEKKVATWVRQKMSEGSAGKELDLLLSTRFSQNVLTEYDSKIASVRSDHEGLSGYAYVDATSYMTKGIEGCDKGALVHRANQIPTLLKTSKCGSCVFNSEGSCQKYKKPIVASANEIVEDKNAYQSEMIRLANASDSELTASLFVNNYDQNEFNLTASEQISVDEEVSHELLGDILFGGFEV
jgi:hypothetical protein